MKKIIFMTLFMLCSCSLQPEQNKIVTDELYIKISAASICSRNDDDTAIYQQYGVSTSQVESYQATLKQDESRRQEIAKQILLEASKCLAL